MVVSDELSSELQLDFCANEYSTPQARCMGVALHIKLKRNQSWLTIDFYLFIFCYDLIYPHFPPDSSVSSSLRTLITMASNNTTTTPKYDRPPADGREALERLRAVVRTGRPIVGGGAGTGISAKFLEQGGVDILSIYNSGRYRMAGRGSLAGLMPYVSFMMF
jgi:hypothetical protein